jgi:hypothetical protein
MFLTTRSVIGVGVLTISCLLGIGASSAQAPHYYTPAPVYTSSTPRYYAPAPIYTSPAPGNSPPSRNYSYYEQNGVEHGSRYPHWSFDYNSWIVHSIH